MAREFTTSDIPLLKLRNDHLNPRHPELNSQVEIIEWMLKEYGQEIYNLAEDIIEKGLSPIENILVVPSDREKGCFIVVEGNRRFTSIRLLHNPTLSHDKKWEKKFYDLSVQHKTKIPKSLKVTIAPSREDVQWILDKRHRGEDKGRGLKPWNAQQAARAQRLRDGQAARYERALNVIDYAVENNILGTDSKRLQETDFPITTLERLLADAFFVSSLGISFSEDGKLYLEVQTEDANHALARVLGDLVTGLSVTKVKNSDLRKGYLTKIKEDLPGPNSKLDTPTPANSAAQPQKTSSSHSDSTRGTRDAPNAIDRRYLITNSIRISDKNINKVYKEIRNLDLNTFPHAAACLLRVFLEQSLDAYILHSGISVSTKDRSGRATLRERLKAVSDELNKKGKIPRDHLKAINAACNANGSLADPDNLHMKLHSKYHFSNKKDLIHIWDTTYEPLLEALWPEVR